MGVTLLKILIDASENRPKTFQHLESLRVPSLTKPGWKEPLGFLALFPLHPVLEFHLHAHQANGPSASNDGFTAAIYEDERPVTILLTVGFGMIKRIHFLKRRK